MTAPVTGLHSRVTASNQHRCRGLELNPVTSKLPANYTRNLEW